MSTALVKLRSERDRMSAIERRIADYILDNAQLLRDYSSQQLANALGISQSSVVKFCQKLGFKGYPDLKLAISEAVIRADSHGSAPTQPMDVSSATAQGYGLWLRKSEAEEATRLINPPGTLSDVPNSLAAPARCSSSAWAKTTCTRARWRCGWPSSASSPCTISTPRT